MVKYIKNLLISLLFVFGLHIVIVFLVAFLHRFNIISYPVVKVLLVIIPLLNLLFGGFIMARKCEDKGWLMGLVVGGVYILIVIIFNYLALDTGITLPKLLFYAIILLSSTFGGMVGIATKK